MSLKERLFGPPWESKDTATRVSAVSSANDRKLFDQLPRIAAEDPEPDVRLAALKRLADESAWLGARARETHGDILAAADRFVMRAACQTPAGEYLQQRLAWLEQLQAGESLRRIAASGADPDMRRAALARINAPGFLGDRVVGESDDTIAAEILGRIEQVSTLKRIAGELRKAHKKRQQAAIQRLAALEAGSETHDARDELAAGLVSRVEKLARGAFPGDRQTEAEQLKAQWRELANPEPQLARRFEGAMRIVESALAPRVSRTPAPVKEAAPATADEELARLSDQAQQMATRAAGDNSPDELSALISAFDRRWNALRSPGEAERAMRERFQALVGELQARLQLQRKPQPVAKADDDKAHDERANQVRALEEALEEALDKADRGLAAGDIASSHEAITSARSLQDRLPHKRRSDKASSRLAQMAGKLKEMRDWQHWSNNELRERLIERVGEIDAENLHPDAVTERLKELRARWKELDEHEVLPGDKRRFGAPQSQWRRFQRACKQAFDAARPYLEKRSEVREQSQRELQEFLDDARRVADDPETPNEKLIRYQRAAREAIRNLDTLPPRFRGKAAGALRELMDAISASLERHFEAAENEKRRLVAEARRLVHEKDRGAAIDRAKSLQAEWKKAGRGRRKVDEQLWNEFREPIDPLFEDLKKERDERKQAEHQHAQALEQLCVRAEELANSDDPESIAGQIAGLEEEFNRHAAAPPALRKRFEQALELHRQQVRAAREARAQAKQAHLASLSGQLQDTWQRIQAGHQSPSPNELPGIPEGDDLARRLLDRLEHMIQASDAQALGREVEAMTDKARQIVIEMECLAGVESPEEDRQRRMDYQVNRLSGRLGAGTPRADLDSELSGLQRRWLESFPHDPEQHPGLQKRFQKAEKILKKMASG